MIYFTADTHFGSERVRFFSNRPFKSVKQTDKTMIKNWNKTAKKGDFVYHLGDFGDYMVIKKLKGKVILIMGNYEEDDMKKLKMTFEEFKNYLIDLGFADVVSAKGIKIKLEELDNEEINLTHKPLDCDTNSFNLFGHVHRLCMEKILV
jgi:calcineurin-like phosphoesterase family protein